MNTKDIKNCITKEDMAESKVFLVWFYVMWGEVLLSERVPETLYFSYIIVIMWRGYCYTYYYLYY
jgi:hypothetical protein